MVGEERPPGLRWLAAPLRHQPRHGALGHVEAELRELAMDSWGAPERVRGGHASDQGLDLGVDRRSTRRAGRAELGPVLAEATPLPSQDGVRRHDDQSLPPAGPDSGQPDPQEAIHRAQSGPGHRSLVDGELLAQGQVLEGELAVAAEEEREEPKQVEQERDHRAEIVAGSEPTDQPLARRPRFWRRTRCRKRRAPVLGASERELHTRTTGSSTDADAPSVDRDANQHRRHRLGHRLRGEAMPIVPCVLIALDKDCVTARDEKSGDDVAAARLRHAAQGHGERPPACISLAAAAHRECYTFIRRFSARTGRLTNRHSTRRRSTCRVSQCLGTKLAHSRICRLSFAPVQRVVAGRPHFAHPGCAARAPREQRLSDLCAPQRALDCQARDGELKFKSRQQAWPSSPDADFPGQAASLRGGETFVVPPRCRKA